MNPMYDDRMPPPLALAAARAKPAPTRSLDRILAFVPDLAPLLDDPSVTEVMVNGTGGLFIERAGAIESRQGTFTRMYLTAAIKTIARVVRSEVSDARPILDARLEDGSRVAAVLPPVAVNGPILTIRKFTRRYTLPDLVDVGTVSTSTAAALANIIGRRRTVLISGATSTGKTTLLNALATLIPAEERIAVIEETSEIAIEKPNLIRLEARKAQPDWQTEVTIGELVRAVLRHRPDRIIVGEVRGAEAFDLLQALNTGHAGSLTTIHGNNAGQALMRLAHCVLMANPGLPYESIHEAIGHAIQCVVHLSRLDGRRVVTELVTVNGYDRAAGTYRLRPEVL